MWFWTFLVLTISAVYGAVMWTKHPTFDLLKNEPFTLTEGIRMAHRHNRIARAVSDPDLSVVLTEKIER